MQPHRRRRGARLGPSGGPRALGAAEKDPDRCSSAGRARRGRRVEEFPYKIRGMQASAWDMQERDSCRLHAVKIEHDSASAVLWREDVKHRDAEDGRQVAQRCELCRLLESLELAPASSHQPTLLPCSRPA